MRTKLFRRSCVFFLVVVLLSFFSFGLIKDGKISFAEEEGISHLTETDYEITNIEKPNGIDIFEYGEKYYGGNATVDWGMFSVATMQISGSDDIVKIVPRELFKKEGKTLHIGKKYGFFVDCRKLYEHRDLLVSTVMLIAVNTENDMFAETSKSHLKIRLTPIFQADFAYVRKGIDEKMSYLQDQTYNFFKDEYQYDLELIYPDSGEDFIVPVPTEYYNKFLGQPHLGFLQHNKYYLTNPSALVSLYNVNQPNPYNEDYIAENDTGCFFSQTDFNYSGIFLQEGEADPSDVGAVVFGAASFPFDLYDSIVGLGSVLKIIPAAGTIFSTLDFFQTISKLENDIKDTQTSEEKKITYTPYYNNKEQQLAAGGLCKDEIIAIKGNTENQLLFGTNNYFEFDYQIHCQDIEVDTRYAAMINIGVVSVISEKSSLTKFGEIFESSSSFCNDLRNHTSQYYKEVPEIELEKNENDYEADCTVNVLPNYYNLVQFTPKVSGKYKFVGENKYSKLSIYQAKNINDSQIDFSDFSNLIEESDNSRTDAVIEEVYLQANETYLLKTELNRDNTPSRYGKVNLKISFIPVRLNIGETVLNFVNSNCEYFRLNFNNSSFYTISCSENGAVFHLFDDELNEIKTGDQNIRVENGGGKTVYLSVSFPATINKEIIILCTKEKDIEFITYTDETIEKQTVINGETYELPTLQDRTGYIFAGWWDNSDFSGEECTKDNLWEINSATIILYAKWDFIKYTITYNENGGSNVPDRTYTIESSFILDTDIRKTGYIFQGWYDNPNFEGTKIEKIESGSLGNRIFYAKWVQEKYAVTLDLNEIAADEQIVSLELDGNEVKEEIFDIDYGQNFILPVAIVNGFTFEGWYYGDEQLTTKLGESISTFTFEEDITLKAKWNRDSYKVKIVIEENKEGQQQVVWLIEGGISKTEATVPYIKNMCPNCLILKLRNEDSTILYREGYKYQKLVDDNGDVFCSGNHENWKWENGKEYTVYAQYEIETYKISFHFGTKVEEKEIAFNEKIEYPEVSEEIGYKDLGWFRLDGKKFNNQFMPDETPNQEDNGALNLIWKSELINYTIEYKLNGGKFSDNITPIEIYTVESSEITLVEPVRAHWTFEGWFEDKDFSGTAITCIPVQSTGNKVFYAKWEPIYYTISFNANGGSACNSITGTYGEKIRLPYSSRTGCTGQWSDGYAFGAFYTIVGDKTFSAKWKANQYKIYFTIFGKVVHTGTYTYFDDFIFGLWEQPYSYVPEAPSSWYTFDGWYKKSTFTSRVTEVTKGETGDKTVYGRWRYRRSGTFTITDDGVFKQDSDWINLKEITGYTLSELKAQGYKSITFNGELTVWQKNDGYKYMQIYDGTGSDAKRIHEWWIDHRDGKTKKVWQLNNDGSLTINLDALTNDTLCFRYTASGTFSDTWYNSDCMIIVESLNK